MQIYKALDNLENEIKGVNLSDETLSAIRFLSLVYKFKEQVNSCEETNNIYLHLMNFLREYFHVEDLIIIEKNLKFKKLKVVVDSLQISADNYEEFEIPVTEEKSLVLRCLRTQMVNDIILFNLFLSEVSVLLKNRFLSDELMEASFKDGLTGLYNRLFLVEHLKKLIPLTLREGKNLGVLMISIDHFKAVIEEFDHTVGDKVLKQLATILIQNLRQSDLIVKYSGDEFMVILANVRSEEDAIIIAQKLVDKFASSEVETIGSQTLKKTICAGLSMFPSDSDNIEQIFKNADIALDEAKNICRSKVLRFEERQVTSIELF